MSQRPFLLSILVLLALTACGVERNVAQHGVEEVHGMDATTHSLGSPFSTAQTFWILDGVSVINTQKTIDDHLVSWLSGEDCSTLKALHGEPYCKPEPVQVPMVTRTVYCYKNLAGSTCYTQPVPNRQPLGVKTEKVPVDQALLP
jgi:hypothetical protein